ncbi:MAG TPA: hypothetical protein VFX80_02370 [Solirubrobacteraceae bacterium]|nr:hypothetical protein [Solirubrobacteraceae bacterium]
MTASWQSFWLNQLGDWQAPVAKAGSDVAAVGLVESASLAGIAAIVTEDFEDAVLDIDVASGSWIRTTSMARTGTWSWSNNDIIDGQTTDAVINVPADATELSFYYAMSSEAGWDYFRFLIDGVQQFQDSGLAATWILKTYDVTDVAQVTFRFVKDSSQSAGLDAVFIDDLVFLGPVDLGPPPEPKAGTDAPAVALAEASTLVKATYEQLFPDAILVQTNLTGAVTAIDEDPDSPDANWLTGGGGVDLRVSFPTPAAPLAPGFQQEFRIRVRPGT